MRPVSLRLPASRPTADKADDPGRPGSPRRTGPTAIEPVRPRPAASLDVWLARDWSESVHLAELEEFQQIHVCTRNSLYEFIVISPRGDVRVRGGKYFPDWTVARLTGCTAGGSFLKRHTITLGLQIEIELGLRRIVTSPVRTIALLQRPLGTEPQ
jgi:hypothetical protein